MYPGRAPRSGGSKEFLPSPSVLYVRGDAMALASAIHLPRVPGGGAGTVAGNGEVAGFAPPTSQLAGWYVELFVAVCAPRRRWPNWRVRAPSSVTVSWCVLGIGAV